MIEESNKENKSLWVYFSVFLITRIVYLLVQPHNWMNQGWEYEELANNLLRSGKFIYYYSWNPSLGLPSAIEPPGLVIILVLAKKYFYAHLFGALATLHLGLAAISYWLFLKICSAILPARATRWAALLYIVDVNLCSPLRWVNETLYSLFFITLFLYLTLRIIEKPSPIRALGLGLSFGLGLYFRATFTAFLLFSLAWLWFIRHKEGKSRMPLSILATIGVSAALAISPWTYRNYKLFGRFIPVQQTMGLNLWQGWNPTSVGGLYQGNGDPMVMEPSLVKTLQACVSETEVDTALRESAYRYARENPTRWIKQRVGSFLFFWHEQTFWAPHSPFRTRQSFILGIANLFLIFFFVISIPAAWSAGGTLRVLLFMMAMQCAIYTLVHADIGNRYRIQIDPLILIVVAFGLSEWFKKLSALPRSAQ